MSQSETRQFPSPSFLLDQIEICSKSQPKDVYGNAVLELSEALKPYENRGTIKGYRTWLLASEYSRQRVLWDSILDLMGKPHSEIRVRSALLWLSNWPHTSARAMSWKKMLRVINDKTVALAYGSFRKIPTPAQIEFVRKGIIDGDRAEKNILVYEPLFNIACYKPSNATTFPNELRSTMWKHFPLIDIVVRNNQFRHKDPFREWQNNHAQIKSRAKQYEPIREFLGELTWERERAENTNQSKMGFVWENNPRHPAYMGYSTSIWESACKGEQKFIDIATRYLVTKQG